MRLKENNDSFRCEYCGGVYTPEQNQEGVRVLGERSPFACPVCKAALELAALAGHRVLFCTHCEGMLVPMDDFLVLIDELRAHSGGAGSVQPPANRHDLERHIDCPKCHRQMDTHIYDGPGNIVIDDCNSCSLNWLDQGELMKVARAPEREYAEGTLRR